jgi:hypothetical protein
MLEHPNAGVIPNGAVLQAKRGISKSTDLDVHSSQTRFD